MLMRQCESKGSSHSTSSHTLLEVLAALCFGLRPAAAILAQKQPLQGRSKIKPQRMTNTPEICQP
jgi:hypothetical protein